MLSLLIWLPIIAAITLMVLPLRSTPLARGMAAAISLLTLGLSTRLFLGSNFSTPNYLYEVQIPWFDSFGISYHLGVNHFNALLILLTSLVGTAAVLTSKPRQYANQFFGLVLLMVGGMIGAFASLDLFFFYIFHEFALIPTFILIGVWGTELRRRAAMKITLYLGLGSLILLFGILALVFLTGEKSFDLIVLQNRLSQFPLPSQTQIWLFGILFLGFGILISVFPFHTWAPIGYGEAPSAAAMLHAGVIKKFGLYGLFTVAISLLPAGFAFWTPVILWMAVGNMIYCGYVALRQNDLRYLFAYSSVSHMGYALLALVASTVSLVAAQGLILFIFAHGLSAATGFAIAGACRDRTGTSEISDLGGLAKKMPFAATVFTMAALAGSGLPGFANFPAELLIFLGSFEKHPIATVLAVWTVVISAVYFLRAVRNVFLGPLPKKWSETPDVGYGNRIAVILLLSVLLCAGFFPQRFLGTASTSKIISLNSKQPEPFVWNLKSSLVPSKDKLGEESPHFIQTFQFFSYSYGHGMPCPYMQIRPTTSSFPAWMRSTREQFLQ